MNTFSTMKTTISHFKNMDFDLSTNEIELKLVYHRWSKDLDYE